ncbi:hypothetical protein ACQ4N7_02120 [Nodosilinea sp. AN01ver1]|uniref:hypothetical protein n=1 Tax=Nodosilinea sp. AN01ver1 TaxID=3423362 RepID=UPI003D31E33A
MGDGSEQDWGSGGDRSAASGSAMCSSTADARSRSLAHCLNVKHWQPLSASSEPDYL